MKVYVVQHEYIISDNEDVKFIGVYSSLKQAHKAVKRLENQPGFCDSKEGFCIDEYEIDKDHWEEGFI